MVVPSGEAARFREKIERELRSGLLSLLLLAGVERLGPVHGYRLLRALQEGSADRLEFKEGTAYPLLQNLEKMGLVVSHWGDGAGGPPRKYYQITAAGRAALRAGLSDWRALVRDVEALLSSKGWEDEKHG